MKKFWLRWATLAAVVASVLVGVTALADPDPLKKDSTKCGWLKNRYCATSCEDSVYVIGLCVDDRDGTTSAISVECCCCTEGANHRSFIGG